ncbi:hypothetical protein AAHE18_01G157200 [Arachis hypogaea]
MRVACFHESPSLLREITNHHSGMVKRRDEEMWLQLLHVGYVISIISTAVAAIVEVKRRDEGMSGGIGDARPGEENRRLSRCGEAMGMRDRRRENGSGDGQVEWGFRDLRSEWKEKEKRKM